MLIFIWITTFISLCNLSKLLNVDFAMLEKLFVDWLFYFPYVSLNSPVSFILYHSTQFRGEFYEGLNNVALFPRTVTVSLETFPTFPWFLLLENIYARKGIETYHNLCYLVYYWREMKFFFLISCFPFFPPFSRIPLSLFLNTILFKRSPWPNHCPSHFDLALKELYVSLKILFNRILSSYLFRSILSNPYSP